MNLLTTVVNLIGVPAILVGLWQFGARDWLAARLTQSIKAEYDRTLEEFKQNLQREERRKQQAAGIANLLSIFVRQGYQPNADSNQHLHELQGKYWELALLLDADILSIVNAAFSGPVDKQVERYKEALIAVRKLYLGKNDPIQPGELVSFLPKPQELINVERAIARVLDPR